MLDAFLTSSYMCFCTAFRSFTLNDNNSKMNALIIYSPVVMKEAGRFNSSVPGAEDSNSLPELRKVEYTEQFGLFTENTWNCEIVHEVEPRNDDIVLTDRIDFSAFAGTTLVEKLKENNIKHFFVT